MCIESWTANSIAPGEACTRAAMTKGSARACLLLQLILNKGEYNKIKKGSVRLCGGSVSPLADIIGITEDRKILLRKFPGTMESFACDKSLI